MAQQSDAVAILERITHDALEDSPPSSEDLRTLRDQRGFEGNCLNASIRGKINMELDRVERSVESGDLPDTALYALQALRILVTATTDTVTAPIQSACSALNASWKYALLRVLVLMRYAEVNWPRVNIAVVESTQIFMLLDSRGCQTSNEQALEAVLGGLKNLRSMGVLMRFELQ